MFVMDAKGMGITEDERAANEHGGAA